jgi:hypothetical protein
MVASIEETVAIFKYLIMQVYSMKQLKRETEGKQVGFVFL